MNQSEKVLLTPAEVTFFITGSIIGSYLLKLPNEVVEKAWQDGWISVIVGAIYPLYILIISRYIINKYPNNDILEISKKVMGKYVGTVFNFIFTFQYLYYLTNLIALFCNLLGVYSVSFISNFKIAIVIAFLGAYTAYCGLKTVAKLNVFAFILTFIASVFSVAAIKEGSILNIMPIMGSGIKNIIIASEKTTMVFRNMVFILILHPFMKEPKKCIKAGMVALIISIILYTWVVFITIFYLGPEVTLKNFWPFITVNDSVQIPVINSFRYVFLAIWIIIILKVVVNYYFIFTFCTNKIFSFNMKKICIYSLPIIIWISLQYGNEVVRGSIYDFCATKLMTFNLVYITLIAILIFFKRMMKNDKNKGI